MKPRIVLRDKLWECFTTMGFLRIGYGYTPDEAFKDWQRQPCRRAS